MKLAKREKYLVTLGGLCLLIFFLFQFLVFPFFEQKEHLKRGVRVRETALKEIAVLSGEYRALKKGTQETQRILAKRKKGFTLFSFLERAAGKAGVKDHIKYMKPSVSEGAGPYKESTVQIKLEKITLKQLVKYLYCVESPEKVIIVKRIEIKQDKKETGYMDAIIHVMTFQT